jgi:hypothetical protein
LFASCQVDPFALILRIRFEGETVYPAAESAFGGGDGRAAA